MVRPLKCRLVAGRPDVVFFKPQGVPLFRLEEVVLQLDEFEALRLADVEGLYQEEASLKMHVSRATFGNILASARKKTADAITNGKAIRIEGGFCRMRQRNRNRMCGDGRYRGAEGVGKDRSDTEAVLEIETQERPGRGRMKGGLRRGCFGRGSDK